MPTPTKVQFFTNVNLLNNAKHHYEMIKNVNPKIELIISMDIEMTATVRIRRLRPGGQLVGRVRDLRDHRLVLESLPADLEGRHPAAVRYADDCAHPGRKWPRRSASSWTTSASAITGSSSWKASREVYIQRLLDSSLTTSRLPVRRHHRRQVRRAGRGADAVPHLPAHPVLGADARLGARSTPTPGG